MDATEFAANDHNAENCALLSMVARPGAFAIERFSFTDISPLIQFLSPQQTHILDRHGRRTLTVACGPSLDVGRDERIMAVGASLVRPARRLP